MLIGISGKALAGKDTVALMLSYLVYCKRDSPELATYEEFCNMKTGPVQSVIRNRIKKFAGPLKKALAACLCIHDFEFESRDFKANYIDWLGLNGRQLMQQFASAIRVQMDENFWIKCLLHTYKPSFTWFISDVRYLNEVNAIKELDGILIRINRPSIESNDCHVSEVELDNFTSWDYVICNNGTLEDLFNNCKTIVDSLFV